VHDRTIEQSTYIEEAGLRRPALQRPVEKILARRGVFGFERGELLFPLEARRVQEADATVPAEDGVVVSGGSDFFGFAERLEGAFEERKKRVRQLTGAELGFGAALVEDSGVVETFVGVGEFEENFFGVAAAVGDAAGELIGEGKAEEAKRELLFRFDGENIAADGFGFFGFVEVAVEFGFGESFGDAGVRDGFELVVHGGLRERRAPTGTFTKSGMKSKKQIFKAWSWRALPSG
jgi:hypothetical protein